MNMHLTELGQRCGLLKIELVGSLKRIVGVDMLEIKLERRSTLREVLEKLPEDLKKIVFRSGRSISPDLLILINGVEFRSAGSGDMYVEDGDTIVIIPVIHGG
ncbi:MAG: MoaD/ThiS family protein [Nitrososphaerota archaeon]